MIDPVTATNIGLALTAVGTVFGVAGALHSAEAQADAAEYQAAVARNNRIIAERNAEDARRRGEFEANVQRQRTQQLIGTQEAFFAGQGVLVGQDSPLDVVADTAALGELDALTIRNNAERVSKNIDL